jgi:hypothetical protein
MLPIGAAVVVLAVLGDNVAAGVLFALVGLEFLLMLLRCLQGAASARRWRRRT